MSEQTSRSDDPAGTQPERTYPVGYCRPPKHSQYKPGQSGNKKGRPKASRNLRSELRKVFTDPLHMNVGGKRRRVPALVAVQRVLLQQALKNDHRAAQSVFKNAKEFGVLDQTETDMSSDSYGLSDEFLRRLSNEAFKEISRIAKELQAEKENSRKIH